MVLTALDVKIISSAIEFLAPEKILKQIYHFLFQVYRKTL